MKTEADSPRPSSRAGAFRCALALVALFVGTSHVSRAAAQTRPHPPPKEAIGATVTVVPAAQYRAGTLRRTLVGEGWREVWLTPVDVPVFSFDHYEGGVEWTERGGGSQSITLHLAAEDGWREYIFRSVNKFPEQGMPWELKGTFAGRTIGDLVHAYFPAAPLLVPPLLEALGILHVVPELRIMPDDPRLGVYRDTLAGMLGTVEMKANEAEGDGPGFAGSSKVAGSEAFLEDLEASKAHTLDQREYLKARFVDFLVNDMDRTRDNFRWARFGTEGDYRWRPLPIDRDWAFVDADGWMATLVRTIFPKFASLGPDMPSMETLTFGSYILDRRLLQRLEREDFREVAEEVRAAVTDDVIEEVVAAMPERWAQETAAPDRIRSVLRTRREDLGVTAMAFYDDLVADVDLHGTDEPDLLVVERLPEGRVRVEIRWPEGSPRAGDVHYARTFLPSETDEIRVDLHGGDDTARVVGQRSDAIVVRLVGGGGDDLLVDSVGGATHLYDAEGENRLVPFEGTRISRRAWEPPEPEEGFRPTSAWAPEWGESRGWSGTVAYTEPRGFVVGLGPAHTSYGFRRLPHHWQVGAKVLYPLGDDDLGLAFEGDYRLENSPLSLTLDARVTTFEEFRFNGYGNDAPDLGRSGLVKQDHLEIRPAVVWQVGWRARESDVSFPGAESDSMVGPIRPLVGRVAVGPVFLWSDAHPRQSSPFETVDPPGSRGGLPRAGLRLEMQLDRTDRSALPRRGWRMNGSTAAYVADGSIDGGFTQSSAEAYAYLPLVDEGPHLALRLGGAASTGTFPVQHSAWVGGGSNLRGHRWERFRGDRAAWGTAELRVPVAPVELLWRWHLGVFGFADVGRVWVGGGSPGGWHDGYGGGLWLEAFGQRIRAAWAQGDRGRLHLDFGTGF